MYLRRSPLSRRTLLRGAGVALALPLLDAMTPALAPVKPRRRPPLRLVYCYVPNGILMESWTPTQTGKDFALPRLLKPLAAFRDDLLVLSGLADHSGNALGDGNGDHSRAGASFLTGVHCKKTRGADIRGGVSADQIAARFLGAETRLPSLELACEDSHASLNCEPGYSTVYTNSLSWRSPTTPVPPEVNPRAVFERLFGTGEPPLSPAHHARREQYYASILDTVQEDTQSLVRTLGKADRGKLDEYLGSVRELEARLQRTEQPHPLAPVGVAKPQGIPVSFVEYATLMFDLQVVAFQTDSTRVSTLMFGREGSMRTYPEIQIHDSHHPLSHHRNQPELVEKIAQINTLHTTLFAQFLGKLKAIPEEEGNLLDHSMVVYGSGISDGNTHTHENLPILVAGRGRGALAPGRHLAYPKDTPLTNLHLTLLDRLGVQPVSLGDSTGTLAHLTAL